MKHIFFLLPVFSLLLAVSSCKKDEVTPLNSLTCKVNGASIVANGLDDAYATKYSVGIEVAGHDGFQDIYFYLPLTATKGSYSFNNNYVAYYDEDIQSFATLYGSGGGSVTIEDIDHSHVKGTFHFTAYDEDTQTVKKTITEGKFNVIID
jgi:hypothetical protein